MKIDRLIGIITILLQRDQVTAPELAERFEVSRRTINRDIEDICRAGIPLVTVQGYGGGISIANGFKIDKSLLTAEELQAIFSGLKGLDSILEKPCLAALLEKLPANNTGDGDMILLDLASHYQASLTQKIAVIRTSIQEKKLLSFYYYYEKGECCRTIEPYKLIFKWADWYVWGWCLDRGAFRLFKLNRLWAVESGEESFTPRALPAKEPDFDCCLTAGAIHLKALFEEGQKYRLVEEYGPNCYFALEGKLLLERDFTSYSNMRQWVFSFGAGVEVLEPAELRLDLLRQAEAMLKKYKGT